MRSSIHRTAGILLAVLALSGGIVACGDDDEGAGRLGRAGGDEGRPGQWQAGRQADRPVDRRSHVRRPRPVLLPDGLDGPQRDPAAAVRLQARQRLGHGARPRRVGAGGVAGRPDRHRQDPRRRQVLGPGRPRGDRQGRQVRDRARLLQHGQQRLRGRLLRRAARRGGRREAGDGDPRDRDARRPHGRVPAHRPAGRRAGLRGARDVADGARREGVRAPVRRRRTRRATASTRPRPGRT